MKLEGVFEGRIYGSRGRRVLEEIAEGQFVERSRLPAPTPSVHRLATNRYGKRLLTAVVGRYLTTNVWRLTEDHWLASLGRTLYTARSDARVWSECQPLPPSSGLRGLLPSSVCVHDGSVYLGEYPLDAAASPRILRSDDYGESWTTVVELPAVRHVHAIQVDPYTGDLWVTTGDTDPQCQIGRLVDDAFEPVVSGGQRFRAVELAFTPEAILWGVDCGYLPSNDLLRLDRAELETTDPTPVVVGSVDSSVFEAVTTTVDDTTWVVFSTASEMGTDQTAPEGTETGSDSRTRSAARVVAASAATDFTRWHTLYTFAPTTCLADLPGFERVLPRASGYVFLEVDPERGLLVNPYNVTPGDGTVIEVPHDRFRALRRADEDDADRIGRRGHVVGE
jgi:hypothetical protein